MLEIVHKKRVANGIEIGYLKDGALMGIVVGDEETLAAFIAAGARTDDEELTAALRVWKGKTPDLKDVLSMKDQQVKVDYSKAAPIAVTAKVVTK